MQDAQYWIHKLRLAPHPEGGFFRETYRASLTLNERALPARFKGNRNVCTAIYFLLEGEHFSAFHRIASDEIWHFYAGNTLLIHMIQEGQHIELKLGANADRGELFQAVVPAGCWFGSCPENPNTFALVGCTVSPGFDFDDFEMAKRSDLIACYPQHRALIERLTR